MIFLFDRFLSDDLLVTEQQRWVLSFYMNKLIEVQIYTDPPCFVALFCVNGKPVLKENMVDNIADYIFTTKDHNNLCTFLLEYATV